LRFLVTGGAGFIGSHVSDALLNRGDSVVVLDNLSTGNSKNIQQHIGRSGFNLVKGSILDEKLVNETIKNVDHIIHLAAAVGVLTIVEKPLESLITNLRGTENILHFASEYNKEVLIASSSEVYGKNTNGPLTEEADRIVGSPLKSRWSYSEAKAIDESMAYFYYLEKGLKVRLVRFFNIVGPRQVGHYGMVVPRFVSAALKGEALKVYGTGSQSRCFCHVQDAVSGLLSVVDSPVTIGEVYNIGNDEEITIEDLARTIIEQTKSQSVIEKVLYETAYAYGFEDMQRRVPNIEKIKRTVGWSPKLTLETIISDLKEYIQD
jgi:UDP-glucose 4-epimerase